MGQGHLAGHLYALTSHVEDRDWLNGNAAGAESFRVRLPTGAERGDDARAGSDDTRNWSGAIFRWKKHDRLIFRRGILINFAGRSQIMPGQFERNECIANSGTPH